MKNIQEKTIGTDTISVKGKKKFGEKSFSLFRGTLRKFANAEMRLKNMPYEVLKFERNILLNIGINEMTTILCSTGGTRFDNANAQLLVGTSTTAEAATQTSLMAVRDQTAWTANTALTLGAIRRPVTVGDANMFVYEVTTAGTTHTTTEPTWPTTDGATVTDGTVVWTARQRIVAAGQMTGFPTFGTAQRMTFRSLFTGAMANFAWNEVMIRNGAVALRGLNRRVISLGTKVSPAEWELTGEILFS